MRTGQRGICMRAHVGMLITLLATLGPITAAQQPAAGRGAAGRGAAGAQEAAPPAPRRRFARHVQSGR